MIKAEQRKIVWMELYLAVVKCCEVVQRVEYLPTGETYIEQQDTSWVSPYKFNGKELDEETGLYYYGAHYYDPRLSLWLGTDPMQGKYPGISTYAYCMGNPVKFVDPDGKKLKLTSFDTYTDLSVIASTLPRDRISETINNE